MKEEKEVKGLCYNIQGLAYLYGIHRNTMTKILTENDLPKPTRRSYFTKEHLDVIFAKLGRPKYLK